MNTLNAVTAIQAVKPEDVVRYSRYLASIQPNNNAELFRRWLFAFASIHTTWKSNVKMYQELAPFETWLGDDQRLKAAIIRSGAGLHNNRTRYISEFAKFFWDHPEWFWKYPHEEWATYRDRIKNATLGIGTAKSSFVVELTYPMTAEVVCSDVHFLRLYGFTTDQIKNGKIKPSDERAAEQHWVGCCLDHNVPPAVTRWHMWDRKQKGQQDPRYWSFVFEPTNMHTILSGSAAPANDQKQAP